MPNNIRSCTSYSSLYLEVNLSLQNQIDPGEACPSPRGDATQYQITFQTASSMVTVNVSSARCTAGRCSHTFMPPSNPPASYDSVSVAAENVVGVGAPAVCTTQTISELNFMFVIRIYNIGYIPYFLDYFPRVLLILNLPRGTIRRRD